MITDLIIVLALGALLAWIHRRDRASWRTAVAAWVREAAAVGRAALRGPLGRLLAVMAVVASLGWGSLLAEHGWNALDPSEHSFEADEKRRCAAALSRLRGTNAENDDALPDEWARCPAGGGRYVRTPRGWSCPVHGRAE